MLTNKRKTLSSDHRLKLAFLLIVDGVLIASNQIGRPTFKYVEMLADLDKFLSFPWGRESFLKTVVGMRPDKRNLGKSTGKRQLTTDPIKSLVSQLQQKTFRLKGFPLALQLIAFRNIPGLLDLVLDDSTSKTILLWKRLTHPKQVISHPQIHALESNLKVFFFTSIIYIVSIIFSFYKSSLIYYYYPSIFEQLPVDPLIVGDLNADQSWAEWDDEVKDKKVAHMYNLIWSSHQFQKTDWPGGDATLPPISVPKKKNSGVHKKHIVDRKKKLGVKSVAPKSKRRYSTRSKPELNLSDDEKSRLISELQTKVEELSNRVMKLEKAKKAVRFKRSTKLSSSFVACSSRPKRKKTMEVPIQSQTPQVFKISNCFKYLNIIIDFNFRLF